MVYIGFKEDFNNNFTTINEIRKGNNMIYKMKSSRDGKEYAVKIYKPKKLMEDLLLSLKEMISYFVVGNNNPNTLKLYEIYGWTNDLNEMVLVLVFDFCDQGSLMDCIEKNIYFSEDSIEEITKQLVSCFDDLIQKYGIYHRDIKPDNIYFKDDKIVIGNFDVCKISKEVENLKVKYLYKFILI